MGSRDLEVLRGAQLDPARRWIYDGRGTITYNVSATVTGDINDIVGAVGADNHIGPPLWIGVSGGHLLIFFGLGSWI